MPIPDLKKNALPITPLELAFGAALLALWVIGSVATFRAEALAVKVIPEALRLGYEEKKSIMDGPVYWLTKKAASVIPPSSSVCLYTPGAGENSSYYFLKARYYLYPRKVLNGGSLELDSKGLKGCGYLVVYATGVASSTIDSDLDLVDSLDKVYEDKGEGAYSAFYRVGGEGER